MPTLLRVDFDFFDNEISTRRGGRKSAGSGEARQVLSMDENGNDIKIIEQHGSVN